MKLLVILFLVKLLHYFHGVLIDFSYTALSLVVSYCPVGGATCGESACCTQQNHKNYRDMTIFYNISLHRESIILTEIKGTK